MHLLAQRKFELTGAALDMYDWMDQSSYHYLQPQTCDAHQRHRVLAGGGALLVV